MCIALLLPLFIVGLIVLFNDYTIEAHELNAEIYLLLDGDDDDVLIKHKKMFSNPSQTGKEPKVAPILSLTVFAALAAGMYVNSGTIIDSPQENIKPSMGFDLVHISPPR